MLQSYAPNFRQSEIYKVGQPLTPPVGPLNTIANAGQMPLSVLNERHKLFFYAEALALIQNDVTPGLFPSYLTMTWTFTRSSNPVAAFTFAQTYAVKPQASIPSLSLANAQTPDGITILWPWYNTNPLNTDGEGRFNQDGNYPISPPPGPLVLVPAYRFEAAADLATLSLANFGIYGYRVWWGVLSN